MRRHEFEVEREEDIRDFLGEMSFGTLATVSEDGWPALTPLNFVFHQGDICFHGSKLGEKMRLLAADNRVSFSVAREFALIPSYWSDPKLACPATSFFKSVAIRGRAEVVTDLARKASILSAFMEKLQPEGGYEQIDPSDAAYAKQLAGTAVVRIVIDTMTAKFKFGQNWKEPRKADIMDKLRARDGEGDDETVRMMKLYCPHHAQREQGD